MKWNALLEVSRLQRELGNLDAAQAAARKALPLARAAQGSQRAWHLGAIATTLAAAGDAPGARELLKEAAQVVATIPDATEKAQALNNIAYDQVRMEDYDDAFRTASSIVDPRIQAHALIGIATEATITDPKQRVWGGLRGKGLSAQKRAVADRALREALPCARAIPSLPGRLQTLSRIAYARAEIRDFAGALEVAHAIPSFAPGEIHKESSGEFVENTKARAHVAIARLQGEAGERAAALRSLRTALPLAQAVASSNEKFYALQEVAEAYAELGEHARAQDVWAEAQALVALLPEPTRSRHLASLVQSKLKAHEIAAALQTAETIADRRVSEKVGALESIAIEQRKAGDRPGARETLRRALACLEAFRKLDPADRPERPKAHDGAGAALGGFGPEDELDEQTLASILRQYSVFLPAQMGDAAAAIKAAKALPGEADEKSNTLANVAQMVAASVDVPAGLEVAATLEDPRARLTAYSYVLHGMIDRLDEQAGKAPRP